MQRGFLCIGTGTYSHFIPALERNLAEHEAAETLFCLTDDGDLLARPDVTVGGVRSLRLPWGRLAWPLPTLLRYHGMSAYADLIRSRVTHLVYTDVDMRVVGGTEQLFQSRLVAVMHPGYYTSPVSAAPFESNPASRASFTPPPSARYVAGGVQGGPVDTYLDAAAQCVEAVNSDHLSGVVATWHDESHWNKLVNTREDVALLGPEYCWPESWSVPAGQPAPHVLALDKDHHALRGTRPSHPHIRRLLQGLPRGLAMARAVKRLSQRTSAT